MSLSPLPGNAKDQDSDEHRSGHWECAPVRVNSAGKPQRHYDDQGATEDITAKTISNYSLIVQFFGDGT